MDLISIIIKNAIKKRQINKNIYNGTYRKKQSLLTQNELIFYKFLKYITDKNQLQVFTQVVIYQLIETTNFEDFNKIRSKTVDFVITDHETNIKICIELDDSTHRKEKRKSRDYFINNLFKNLGIKLLRIPVKSYYDLGELEKKIKESL